MSSLYNLEPQPTAKVVLQTTSGDLSFELFAKQTPLASRNFLQHCLDGYYNNTIFHRLVPGFVIQGGDPTGSGSGGISAINNGDAFEDEFHSRLKYNRRGLLGMANEGKDSNGSQFFITLGTTPELQGKNTLFGRIEGDTIYNLMKMAEAELAEGEGSERPLYPTRIIGAEVLVNPFDDMMVRVREAPRSKADDGKKGVKKRRKPTGKNALSFADDEGDGDTAAPVSKKAKANPRMVTVDEEDRESSTQKEKPKTKPRDKIIETSSETEVGPEIAKPATHSAKPAVPKLEVADNDEDENGDDDDDDEHAETEEAKRRREALEKTNADIAAIKASLKRNIDVTSGPTKDKPKSTLESMIPSSSTRGRKRGKATDERGAIDLFKAFKNRLEGIQDNKHGSRTSVANANGRGETATAGHTAKPAITETGDEEAELCDLHFIANCQSCKSWDEDKPDGEANADGDNDPGWMSHTLTFAKDTLGKDLEWKKKMEEIEVIDPREKARAIKDEKRKHREKGKR